MKDVKYICIDSCTSCPFVGATRENCDAKRVTKKNVEDNDYLENEPFPAWCPLPNVGDPKYYEKMMSIRDAVQNARW